MSFDLSSITSGKRLRAPRIIVLGTEKIGKALDSSTPIPVPGGWSKIAELKAKDTVFDKDGVPVQVLSVTPEMFERPCFRITLSDGTNLVADSEHQWLVHRLRDNALVVKTTAELIGKLSPPCGDRYNYAIPVAGALRLPAAEEQRLNLRTSKRKAKKNAIVCIDPVQSVPVKCIEVDSPSGTFLAGEQYTVTHNSTFAASAPNPAIFPVKGEEGMDDIDAFKVPTCNSFNDVLGWLYSLGRGEHNYETVVIDSASTLEPLIWDSVCEKHGQVDTIEKVLGGYGKGYTEATKTWRQITEVLDALRTERNMASIIIGHVKIKRFDDPIGGSYDTFQFDIHDKAASLLYRWADAILFANTKTTIVAEDIGFNKEKKHSVDAFQNQRFLYTQKRPSHPGGGRGAFGRVPYEMDLNWATWMAAVGAAG